MLKLFNEYNRYPVLVIFIAGLYPFFHYYNGNISDAFSWEQVLFLIGLCFMLPQILLFLMPFVLKVNFLNALRSKSLSILSCTVFLGLIGFFLFFPNKKRILGLIIVGVIIGWFLSKHFKTIIFLKLILASISIVTFFPKLIFQLKQDNESWALITEEELQTKFLETPNIFVIQPDGYVNFSEIDKPPYNFDNSDFKKFLKTNGFVNYEGFRSNYYSTYTSNSSMFAMKHHYYSNTNKSTLKTHNANEVIIGDHNNVIKILKKNNYKNYLITDNSYFLINRAQMTYDHCNIKSDQVSFYRSGVLRDFDFMKSFKTTIDTITTNKNFFFIERTIPGHIRHKKSISKGKEGERLDYIEELKTANVWLTDMIKKITTFDNNALVVIVADHGGYVGLDYTMEATQRRLNQIEVKSSFSTILSIKWPKKLKGNDLQFKSNVNLFRNIFYLLSEHKILIENYEKDESYLPLKSKFSHNYYKNIDLNGNVVFELIPANYGLHD